VSRPDLMLKGLRSQVVVLPRLSAELALHCPIAGILLQ